jgi:membrane-associated phospholipid phosphatase
MKAKRSGKAPAATRLGLAAPAACAVVLWLIMFVEGAGPFDRRLLVALYAGQEPLFARAAALVTLLGGGYFVTVVSAGAALVLALRRQPWPALVLFAGNLLGRLIVDFQKYQIGRLRPDANPHLVEVATLSFPSGHSANAVMTYVAIALFLAPQERGRWYSLTAAVALALIIGLSRVMLGVHYPSDVVGGWAFGALWVQVMLWFAGLAANDRRQGRHA